MPPSPLRRTLCVLAALSLVLSAAPASGAAIPAEGHHPAVSTPGDAPVVEAGEREAAPAATVTAAELSREGPPGGSGPCSMPLSMCAGGGACASMIPLPTGASPAPSSGPVGVPLFGTEGGPSSPATGILTPPPRS